MSNNMRVQVRTEIRFVCDGYDRDEPDCVVEYEGRWQGKKIPTRLSYKPVDFDRESLNIILEDVVRTLAEAEAVTIEVSVK